MNQYSLYGQRISETYPRLLQITSGDTVLDGSGDTRSLYVNGSFSADTIFIGSSDLNNIFAPIGAIGSGATTFIRNGLNTYTGGTPTSPTVNVSAATLSYLSATTISGDTIYSGGTNLYQIFSTIGSGDIVRVQPGSNIITAGTVNAPIIGVVESPSFNNLTLSGLGQFNSVSASSFSATSFYSGNTNLYSIFATIGSSGPSTFVQPGLNTYTGGTNEAPTVNVSAATLSYLSASTISGSSLYVQGPFKYVDGNQGTTKVLTSDAFGNASWQEIPAIGIGTFMFVSGASDIATYKQMVPLNLYNSDGLIQDTTNVTTTPTLIGGFATNEGYPGITFIPLGNFLAHFETKKSAGSNNYYSFYEVFKYSSGGSETYLFSSDTSTVTSSNQVVQNTLYSHVTSGITLEQTDRIIVKIFSVMLSSSANITLQYDNNTGASFIMPSSSVDTTHLIPYTGATSNVDLGSYNLSSNEINGNVLLSGNTNLSQIFATTGSTYLPTQQIAFGSSNSGITGYTNLTWNGNYVNIDSNSLTQLYLTGPGVATSIGHNSGIFFVGGTGGGMQIFNAAVNTLAAEFLITRSGIYAPLTIYSGASSNSFSSTTLSAGTFYSGSTPLETIITNLSIGGTSTYVQPGLNTYTGGTSSAPTVNISAATLSYLSATTVSANTAYLLNMQPNQVAFVHPSTSGLTGDTNFKFFPNIVGGGYGQIGYLNLGYGIAYGGYFGIDMSAFGTSRISSSLSLIELDRITGFGNVSIIVQNRRALRGDYSGVTFGPSLETESTARVDITSGTSIIPQLRVRSGETYSGSYLDGSIWNDGSHLYGMFGGEVRVLDSGSTGNGSQTFIQPGLNTYTGGTSSAPTVNISAATLSYLSASTISGGTFYGDGSGLSGLGNSITVTLGWKFDTSTTSSDPGSGNFRFNNSTPANISQIFVDNNTTNGINASVILNRLRSGSEIYVQQKDNPSTAILFSVTSSTIDNSGWFTIPVAYVSDNGGVVPQNNKDCVFILFNSPSTDSNTYVTGFTYNDANRLTIQQNDVSDLSVFINTMTGLTVTGGISGATISGGTLYSGATNLSTTIINVAAATGDFTRVQGSNFITTGGTANAPTINLAQNLSGATISGGTLYSGATNLSTTIINVAAATGDFTRVQAGSNIATGGTANAPTISVIASPSLNGLTLSGAGQFAGVTSTGLSATTVSATTLFSGATNLSTTIISIANAAASAVDTAVQAGSNIATGGTAAAPIISVVASPSLNALTLSGAGQFAGVTSTGLSANTLSGGTLYSGATNLSTTIISIANAAASAVDTAVQAGSNIATGGTANAPTISVVASPSLNALTLSGAGQFAGVTSTVFSGGTVSGGTFYSGSTPLETIITNLSVGGSSTYVQPGFNTYTGGTSSTPTVNISAATLVTISGGTVSGGTIYSGSTNLNDVFQRKSGYLLQKAGLLSGSTFVGSPRKSTVTFTTPFANNLYSINVVGEINRTWSIESRTASGFTINSNSTTAFSSSVFWTCCEIGEGYR